MDSGPRDRRDALAEDVDPEIAGAAEQRLTAVGHVGMQTDKHTSSRVRAFVSCTGRHLQNSLRGDEVGQRISTSAATILEAGSKRCLA
jgi:hypothetical protein